MAQYIFGSGILWGTPTADATGAAIVNPTPVEFGTLQDISLDVSFDTKLLYGNLQFPVAVGRGKGKVSGKAKFAQLNGSTINSLFFGQTMTNGIINDIKDTTGMLIPATPFTITASSTTTLTSFAIPDSGTWSADLGISDTNGVPFTRVASAPVTGQYTVTAGVYVFAAADAGKTVFIDYQYTATSTTAVKSTIMNLPMGYAPSFKVDLAMPYAGKRLIFSLPNAISSKLTLATKQDDFMIPEFDFDAFASSSGQIMTYALTDN
jgi:hypothetical protein